MVPPISLLGYKLFMEYPFVKKVLITIALTALLVLVILIIRVAFPVLLMVLAGSLIAIYFRGLGDLVSGKFKLSKGWGLTVSITSTLLLITAFLWFLGYRIQDQFSELTDTLPSSFSQAKEQLSQFPLGKKLVDLISGSQGQQFGKKAAQFFQSAFGVLGDIYIILFLGIFFTANPGIYTKGVLQLVPTSGRKKAQQIISELDHTLRSWLKGKLFAMAVVFVLTIIGLLIMGMPMPIALALIAGTLNFIPNFGPLIAMIPAVLVGLGQGGDTALLVAGLYILVQALESNFITPLAQKKLVSIPPAMIIISQLIVGSVTGYLGLVLATPLFIICMVITKKLYIDQFGKAG